MRLIRPLQTGRSYGAKLHECMTYLGRHNIKGMASKFKTVDSSPPNPASLASAPARGHAKEFHAKNTQNLCVLCVFLALLREKWGPGNAPSGQTVCRKGITTIIKSSVGATCIASPQGTDRGSWPSGCKGLREVYGGAKRAKHRAKRSPEYTDPEGGTPK